MIKTEGGHFWLKFDNGYTLSCFNGFGSYTENHFNYEKFRKICSKDSDFLDNSWESETIEIAILYDGQLVTQDILKCDDEVKSVDLNELVKIINIVSKLRG